MDNNFMNVDFLKEQIHKHWGWFLAWGIALIILGLIAIGISYYATLAIVLILGILLVIGGFLLAIDSFKFWGYKWSGFFPLIFIAILYIIIGIMLLTHPVLGAMSLTLLLASFYIVVGVFRIIYILMHRVNQWGWVFLNGLISLIIGILIAAHWPAISLFIIGLFVGIDMIFSGWSFIMLALSASSKHEVKRV